MMNIEIFEENGYKWSYKKTSITPYYYDIGSKKIWCDYNLFRMIHSIDESEYKNKDKESRCVIINKKGLPVKCRLNCSSECPFGYNLSKLVLLFL